jgi:hypothetical protein
VKEMGWGSDWVRVMGWETAKARETAMRQASEKATD